MTAMLCVQVMKYKLVTPMTGLDVGLKREWLIGQQLNTITGQDGELHGMLCAPIQPYLHIAGNAHEYALCVGATIRCVWYHVATLPGCNSSQHAPEACSSSYVAA